MKYFNRLLLMAALSSAVSLPAFAHHSFSATFQPDAPITKQGIVTRVLFKNPHVLVYMNVENDQGELEQWVAEATSAISMRRDGWTSQTVKPGDLVSVYGDSTHDGSPMVSLDMMWLLDPQSGQRKKTLHGEDDAGVEEAAVSEYHELPLLRSDGTPNLEAVWSYRLQAQTVGAGLPSLPYSEAGKARKAAFDVRHDLQVFCDLPGAFRQIFQNPYPLKFTQGEDVLTIEYEEYAGIREIPFADAPIDTGINSRLGDSAARYENNELVIETINFLENPGTTSGDYVSDKSRIVERFRRGDDDEVGAIIEIDVTVYDPVYLTEPYTVSRRKSIIQGYQYTLHECETPLRERTVVSPYMTLFALEGDGGGAMCQASAQAVGQGDKGWTLASGGAPQGVYYDATGEIVEQNSTIVSARGDRLDTGAVGLQQCYATKNFIAPVSSQTTPQNVSSPEVRSVTATDKKDRVNVLLYVLLGAVIGGFIAIMLRRRKTT